MCCRCVLQNVLYMHIVICLVSDFAFLHLTESLKLVYNVRISEEVSCM